MAGLAGAYVVCHSTGPLHYPIANISFMPDKQEITQLGRDESTPYHQRSLQALMTASTMPSTSILTLVILLTSTTTTFAHPNPITRSGSPGGVYICTEPNFTGNCLWIAPAKTPLVPPWPCMDVPPDSRNFESFGPDAGATCVVFTYVMTCPLHRTILHRFAPPRLARLLTKCVLWSESKCQGGELALMYPGNPDMGASGWPPGSVQSYACYVPGN